MSYTVVVLPRARDQITGIVQWLAEHSPEGAARWLVAYDEAVDRLADHAGDCGLAPEDEYVTLTIRQILFKTRRGQTYRALFTIEDSKVRILAVRGPGQELVPPEELDN